MLVPVKWLKKYVDINEDTKELADKITYSGSHVESINKFEHVEGLVVAQIKDIKKHEEADNLNLVELDYGENITVVSAAKNMNIGDKVVFAKYGAKLPGDITIGEVDFKGFKSRGMLVGYSELGISENYVNEKSQGGIIILPQDSPVGIDAVDYLDLDDEIIEFEITPNRPDCLSIIGMAREVAAVYIRKIVEPSIEISQFESSYNEFFDGVELESDKVNRFLTAVIKDVQIKDSPIYIQNALRDAGMRPINNIVDFTNFVMLEYGQPLHAYDLDKIKGKKLIVRDGLDGEKLTTLDEKEREIKESDLLICDGENAPIGFAGVMGGMSTEVDENTNTILIEAASFNAENIRRTSKRLNLRTEASTRFEKSVPAKLSEIAIKRFLKLVEETNSGTIVEGIEDKGDYKLTETQIVLRNKRSNALLGIDLNIEESKEYLESLELETKIDGDNLIVNIPYFRTDLTKEVDLIEEVGRMYGFHNITPKRLKGELTKGVKSDLRNLIDEVKLNIYALSYSEILTYSFVSNKMFDKLNIEEDNSLRNTIKIINPLGEDFSVMRTTLIGNMLETIKRNLNNRQFDLKFFEVGNTFQKYNDEMIEEKLLTFASVGEYDFYSIKNDLINLLNKFGIKDIRFKREESNNIFHAGRSADVLVDGEQIGTIGEISPFVLENYNIEKRVNLAEINLDKLLKFKKDAIQYEVVSKYPIVERDIAFVIDENIESQDIIDTIISSGGEYIKYVQLFDRYDGEQIEDGKVSLAYSIGFQSNTETLKDNIVKEAFENIENELRSKYDIDLRS